MPLSIKLEHLRGEPVTHSGSFYSIQCESRWDSLLCVAVLFEPEAAWMPMDGNICYKRKMRCFGVIYWCLLKSFRLRYFYTHIKSYDVRFTI